MVTSSAAHDQKHPPPHAKVTDDGHQHAPDSQNDGVETTAASNEQQQQQQQQQQHTTLQDVDDDVTRLEQRIELIHMIIGVRNHFIESKYLILRYTYSIIVAIALLYRFLRSLLYFPSLFSSPTAQFFGGLAMTMHPVIPIVCFAWFHIADWVIVGFPIIHTVLHGHLNMARVLRLPPDDITTHHRTSYRWLNQLLSSYIRTWSYAALLIFSVFTAARVTAYIVNDESSGTNVDMESWFDDAIGLNRTMVLVVMTISEAWMTLIIVVSLAKMCFLTIRTRSRGSTGNNRDYQSMIVTTKEMKRIEAPSTASVVVHGTGRRTASATDDDGDGIMNPGSAPSRQALPPSLTKKPSLLKRGFSLKNLTSTPTTTTATTTTTTGSPAIGAVVPTISLLPLAGAGSQPTIDSGNKNNGGMVNKSPTATITRAQDRAKTSFKRQQWGRRNSFTLHHMADLDALRRQSFAQAPGNHSIIK